MAEYSLLSKALHRLALGCTPIARASFDFERSLLRPVASQHEPHVFIAGLARAGTTMLMRALHETGAFASLTYRDMPFVLAPNVWARLHQDRADTARTERAQGDGIKIDFDSPEALEEVFWRVFAGHKYIASDRLLPMHADNAMIEQFRAYVALIVKRYHTPRYLSKNNNNILRLESIRASFPNATILVPFRDPLQHAYSLLTQHQRFCALHQRDPFARRYMTWLAHHEFGGDHRPFVWGIAYAGHHTTNTLDYWLAQWIGVYEQLIEDTTQPLFVGYEVLCTNTKDVWSALSQKLSLPDAPTPAFTLKISETPEAQDTRLLARARELYAELSARAIGVSDSDCSAYPPSGKIAGTARKK